MGENRVPGNSHVTAVLVPGITLNSGVDGSASAVDWYVIPATWAAPGACTLPPDPADGDTFVFFDPFTKITMGNALTVNAGGVPLPFQITNGILAPAASFAWTGTGKKLTATFLLQKAGPPNPGPPYGIWFISQT